MSGVFTLPAGCCFVTTLADGLWRRVGGDPLALASYEIYLPTRRACRALREAFLRVSGARAALLPRLLPLGDVDDADFAFEDSAAFDALPPAIAPLRRQMLLTQMIATKDKTLPLDQAASLAAALGALLDQAQTASLDLSALGGLVESSALAAHWQETLKFLEIVTKAWPLILQEEGCLDPAARRVAVMDSKTALWRSAPPPHPVIVAGSTGSVPAAGRLMAAIAALPKGEVILPALDVSLDQEAWQVVEETHPQFTMKQWLETSGFKREDVALWNNAAPCNAPRVRLLQEALRPAAVTDAWQNLTEKDVPKEATSGLEALLCDHARHEAEVIALRLRAALEEEGKTAALVTPDRALAARVAAALTRWDIAVNDSAGAALDALPVGRFLIEALKAAAPHASATDCLTLLKHPLMAAGAAPEKARALTAVAEKALWRGVARVKGWQDAAQALEKEESGEAAAWLFEIAALFAPLTAQWGAAKPLEAWIEAHCALCEALADRAPLWRGEDGQAAAAWLADWRGAVSGFGLVTAAQYLSLFEELARQVIVRPAYGQHPRLSILGPLEARLLHHDLIILGGLREGVWPPDAPIDPWLSRPMKAKLGLPSPERRIGLSAHDFACLASAPQVLLTRSKRAGGSPAVPSRFWVQLETVLQAAGRTASAALAPEKPWTDWARQLDAPSGAPTPVLPPAPRPPLDVRPKRLSVTEIGTWLTNPYAIYAKHILKLKKLDPIDADPSMADFGTALHAALEAFEKDGATTTDALLDYGRAALAPFAAFPQVEAYWWPRFERMAAWYPHWQAQRRARGIKTLAVETAGKVEFEGLTLTGRADRIDADASGNLEIIDYKSGLVPSKKAVLEGYEPQLALLGMMAMAGAIEGVDSQELAALTYLAPLKRKEGEREVTFTDDLLTHCDKACEGLKALIAAFAQAETAYIAAPDPRAAPRYNDYAHLSRIAEWRGAQEEGEE